jgi:hypothetical protein
MEMTGGGNRNPVKPAPDTIKGLSNHGFEFGANCATFAVSGWAHG